MPNASSCSRRPQRPKRASSCSTGTMRRSATESIAHATNTIGVAMARSGNLDSARAHIERSLNAARDSGLLDVACRAYANLGVLYGSVEPQRAIEVSLTGLELASKIGAASLQSYIYANLAAAYCALTERCDTEGLQAARAAADLDRELGQLDHLAVPLIVIAQIHQCRGALQEAQETYREALALAEKAGEPQLILEGSQVAIDGPHGHPDPGGDVGGPHPFGVCLQDRDEARKTRQPVAFGRVPAAVVIEGHGVGG